MTTSTFSNYSGSATHIRIDPSVESIPDGAFHGNHKLVEVELPDSIRSIGNGAFYNCSSLKRIHLCEGLCRIGGEAFKDCISLHRVIIPSTVSAIGFEVLSGCSSLKEAQLKEGLQTIGTRAFSGCRSLLRINIPSTVNDIDSEAFSGCTLLRNVAIYPSPTWGDIDFLMLFRAFRIVVSPPDLRGKVRSVVDCTNGMLKSRFDDVPLHKHCHDHCHQLMEIINRGTSSDFLKADCLGMTPLHVLACSGMHDLSIYLRISEICPNAYIAKDEWGGFPLAYIIWSEAPKEVLHLFLEMHRRNAGTIPLDFSAIIKELANFAFGDYMRQIIQAQRTYFRDLEIDWQIIGERIFWIFQRQYKRDLFINPVEYEYYDGGYVVHVREAVRVLMEASVSQRAVCMSLEHQSDIENAIVSMREVRDEFGNVYDCDDDYDDIRYMVIRYADQYHNELVEATTTLELALWKMLLAEALQLNQNIMMNDRSIRRIRSESGQVFNVVIPNVLSFF